jgi:RNA polymerase sigma-70 factor (family 1)
MECHTIKDEPLLVSNLSKGNLLAFNTLYNEYSSHLYHFAFRYLKSKDEAEDLVQQVFTIIWEKRASLRKELSFKSFLFTISFNIIRKYFRTKTYLSEYIKTEKSCDVDTQTSQEITYDSLYQYVKELADNLPKQRKEIFIKSKLEGHCIKEIAGELKISHKTVENQLTNALKFIRTNIKKERMENPVSLTNIHTT